jgi:hypothetical protein
LRNSRPIFRETATHVILLTLSHAQGRLDWLYGRTAQSARSLHPPTLSLPPTCIARATSPTPAHASTKHGAPFLSKCEGTCTPLP